jgi:predicted DNA repair protein MutK
LKDVDGSALVTIEKAQTEAEPWDHEDSNQPNIQGGTMPESKKEKLGNTERMDLVLAATEITVAAIGTYSSAMDVSQVQKFFEAAFGAVHAAYLGNASAQEKK